MPLNKIILKQAMKARKVFAIKTEETLYLKKNMFSRKVDFKMTDFALLSFKDRHDF